MEFKFDKLNKCHQDHFIRLYVEEGKKLSEIGSLLGVSTAQAYRVKNFLGLERTVEGLKLIARQKQKDIERTSFERYGCKNPGQNKEAQLKRAKTNKEKYGVENVFQNSKIMEKAKLTCLDKYGFERYQQTLEYKSRIRENYLEKYGTESFFQTEEFKEKAKIKSLENYGTLFPFQAEEVKQKARNTNIERYGVPAYSQSFSAKLARKEKERDRGKELYGRGKWREGVYDILASEESFEAFVTQLKDVSVPEIAEELGVSQAVVVNRLKKFHLSSLIPQSESGFEHKVNKALKGLGVESVKTRQLIPPYEIDIFCPTINFAIECNGNYWHREDLIGEGYHLNKTLLCQNGDIFLYHIFEYEWDSLQQRGDLGKMINYLKTNTYPIISKESGFVYSDIAKEPDYFYKEQGFVEVGTLPPDFVWFKTNKKPILSKDVLSEKNKEVLEQEGYWKIYDCGKKIWRYKEIKGE